MGTMTIAVIRPVLILLSAYAINQPRSLWYDVCRDWRRSTTQRNPNGSIDVSTYHQTGRDPLSRRGSPRNPPVAYRDSPVWGSSSPVNVPNPMFNGAYLSLPERSPAMRRI